ncbi:CU044_2847 family protein [Nostoc sp.]|uniref:CU044_2847 family protein n=1 Tax=Nostoc sp. TaxID=1180 RepID=UPI002FFA96AF
MPEIQRLLIQEGNETYEVYVEAETTNLPEPGNSDQRPGQKGGVKDIVDLDKARQVIRGYTLYVLGAFKNFAGAEIEELNIKFGIKFTGTSGIPMIAQGSAEQNVEISVRCKFPNSNQNSSSS